VGGQDVEFEGVGGGAEGQAYAGGLDDHVFHVVVGVLGAGPARQPAREPAGLGAFEVERAVQPHRARGEVGQDVVGLVRGVLRRVAHRPALYRSSGVRRG